MSIDLLVFKGVFYIELASVVAGWSVSFFFVQAEDGIRVDLVTGVQTCALPICKCPALP